MRWQEIHPGVLQGAQTDQGSNNGPAMPARFALVLLAVRRDGRLCRL
jgi:hypothetical protein